MEVRARADVGVKILRHVAKFPRENVNGLLIGEAPEGKDGKVALIDAIPLFSGFLDLTPMVEVAMEQVHAWATKNGKFVAGYYECRSGEPPLAQSVEAAMPKAVGSWIGEQRASSAGPVVFALVDEEQWLKKKAEPFATFTVTGNKGAQAASMAFSGPVTRPSPLQDSFRTFDEFLDDPSADWTNISRPAQ